MNKLTEQFVKEVLTGKNQFTFSFGTDCLYAINIKRGKSRFIYGCYIVVQLSRQKSKLFIMN